MRRCNPIAHVTIFSSTTLADSEIPSLSLGASLMRSARFWYLIQLLPSRVLSSSSTSSLHLAIFPVAVQRRRISVGMVIVWPPWERGSGGRKEPKLARRRRHGSVKRRRRSREEAAGGTRRDSYRVRTKRLSYASSRIRSCLAR